MIKINTQNKGQFVQYFAGLYEMYSAAPYPARIRSVHPVLQTYIANFCKKIGEKVPDFELSFGLQDLFNAKTINHVDLIKSNRPMIGFSGGKDGLAVAILLKKQNPILYHLYGINRTYKFERNNARALADMMGLEYVEEEVRLSGKQDFPDHPFKNQLIMAHMVDYGITLGVTDYYMGNHRFENCDGANVRLEFSDSGEQIDLFDTFIRSFVNNYQRETLLENNEHAIKIVADHDPKMFELFTSCVMPAYRKPMLRKYIEKNYPAGVLLPGRCGYCYKCTKEYMLLADWGLLPMDKPFYERCKMISETKNPVMYI